MIPKYTQLSIENVGKAVRGRVLTVTLNPATDRTMWVPGFKAGTTCVVERGETVSGGKGVNVSRALARLGIGSVATGLIARGGSETFLGFLDEEGLSHDFVFVQGSIRTNVTILSEGNGEETHLREKGPPVTEDALAELEEKLKKLSDGFALTVFSGSLPAGLSEDTYRRVIGLVRSLKGRAVLDASGEPLRIGLEAKPFLIKPNAHEVEESLGFFPAGPDDLRKAGDEYRKRGIEAVMVSLGRGGLFYSRGGASFLARLAIEKPVNTVGSGDAALAGGIAGILGGLSEEDTTRFACAVGAANTLASGACVFRPEDVEYLVSRVEMRGIG